MKSRKTIFSIFILACLLSVIPINFLFAAMTSNSGYQIWADTVSIGGGEVASSSNFSISDTVGESVAGASSSTNYSVKAGYREMENDVPILTLSLGGSSLNLGTLSEATAATASHTLTLRSNSVTGVSLTFSGATLTSGVNQITAIGATATSSLPGTSQFGFNAIYSSGDSSAASQAPYNNPARYAFDSSSPIISSSGSMSSEAVFNINYIANISASQPSGSYATNITYTAIANF